MSFFQGRDEDQEEELMAKALYVDPEYLNADVEDDGGPPVSAADYLRRVAREAKAQWFT